MIRRDMPEVQTIENLSFEFKWKEDDFIKVLRQRNCIGMVAEVLPPNKEARIAGFMIYELHKKKLRVINFAVHPIYRRKGVGTAMVKKLIGKLGQLKRELITLEVRETNLDAQLFFRQQRFMAMEVLKNRYEDSDEDSYVMEYLINTDEVEKQQRNKPSLAEET